MYKCPECGSTRISLDAKCAIDIDYKDGKTVIVNGEIIYPDHSKKCYCLDCKTEGYPYDWLVDDDEC